MVPSGQCCVLIEEPPSDLVEAPLPREEVFPIEAQQRAKDKLKAYKDKVERETGVRPTNRSLKKAKPQEAKFDDCGSDMDTLQTGCASIKQCRLPMAMRRKRVLANARPGVPI